MTTVVRPVTKEHIDRLVELNTKHADKTRQAVLDVLRQFEKPLSPHHIKKALDLKSEIEIRRECLQKYQRGTISGTELKGIISIKLHSMIKKRTLDIRTIHRKLAALVKEGLIENKKGEYSLTIKAKSDIRYFADKFGQSALSLLMSKYFPHSYATRNQSVQELVTLFGTYILFCFIETALPLDDNSRDTSRQRIKKNDIREKEHLVHSCLHNIISIESMYNSFLAIVDFGLYNDNLSKGDLELFYRDLASGSQKFRKELTVLPSALDLSLVRNLRRVRVAEKAVKEKEAYHSYFKGRSWDELDKDKLKRLSDVFRDAYPIQYQRLHKVKSGFNRENPKQTIVDIREDWPSII